jgi:hypothetical protein
MLDNLQNIFCSALRLTGQTPVYQSESANFTRIRNRISHCVCTVEVRNWKVFDFHPCYLDQLDG